MIMPKTVPGSYHLHPYTKLLSTSLNHKEKMFLIFIIILYTEHWISNLSTCVKNVSWHIACVLEVTDGRMVRAAWHLSDKKIYCHDLEPS